MEKFDLIVIGGGAAGLNVAGIATEIGIRVLLINKSEATMGGECTHVGCIPSKALLHVAKLAESANDAQAFGIRSAGKPDWKKTKAHINKTIKSFHKQEDSAALKKKGIATVFGQARFLDNNSVVVNGKTYTAKKLVLATGSQPRHIELPGIEHVKYHTNETIFSLDKVPRDLLVIGGGAIGIELAYAFTMMGSRVSIVNRDQRILIREPKEASDIIHKKLTSLGVKIYNSAHASEFTKLKQLKFISQNKKQTTKFDEVLIAAGRVVNLGGLDVKNASIRLGDNGAPITDKFLRTTNKRIYACGDVVGQQFFTHATELHASIVVHNLFNPLKKKLSYDNMSRVTFTSPEVASFGLSELELKERNINYKKRVTPLKDMDRARTDDFDKEANGTHMLYVTKKGKLLGGTIVAPMAGEIMQELVLAKQNNLGMLTFLNKIYAYPVASRINQWAMAQFFFKSVPNFVKKVGRIMYRIF